MQNLYKKLGDPQSKIQNFKSYFSSHS